VSEKRRTVVVGVGNPLRGDDGVGLAVARLLRERLAPDDGPIDVVELAAGGLRLAESICGYDRALVVDAVAGGAIPIGDVRRLRKEELGATRSLTCAHDASFSAALDLIGGLGLPLPGEISVWGIGIEVAEDCSDRLSEPIARAVPIAAELLVAELESDEEAPRPKGSDRVFARVGSAGGAPPLPSPRMRESRFGRSENRPPGWGIPFGGPGGGQP
jgi:hydrogenase maturation protease